MLTLSALIIFWTRLNGRSDFPASLERATGSLLSLFFFAGGSSGPAASIESSALASAMSTSISGAWVSTSGGGEDMLPKMVRDEVK